MTVKQLIRRLQHPPCKRIAAVRIEFADGGIYEIPPDTRRISPSNRLAIGIMNTPILRQSRRIV
jgi:hypothetical protein